MSNVKVKLGIIFLVIGMGILFFYPAYSVTSDGMIVIHYFEIIGGFALTVLGIFNIVKGRKEKA